LVNSSIIINDNPVSLGDSIILDHMPDVIMLMGC
jgi:hypothetical protein